jgi:hypothetical protein
MKSTAYKKDSQKVPPVLDPERFMEERRYLNNVTAKTLEWYHQSFKSL